MASQKLNETGSETRNETLKKHKETLNDTRNETLKEP